MSMGGSRNGSPVFGWCDRCRVLSEALPSSMTRLKNVPELKSCRIRAEACSIATPGPCCCTVGFRHATTGVSCHLCTLGCCSTCLHQKMVLHAAQPADPDFAI